MTTKLDIWNAALALLPHDIAVREEDEISTEAERCRQHWDGARRAVLSAREWGWLVRETPTPGPWGVWGGASLVPVPGDALRVMGFFHPDGRRARAEAVNGTLRCLEPGAALRYLPDEEDPEAWPPDVRDAVAAELAARLAPVITDNPARMTELRALAQERLTEASLRDASAVAWGGSDPYAFVHARR